MKYLVNRETKEHRIAGDDWADSPTYKVVEADAEGWIKWEGCAGCPLPDGVMCHVKLNGEHAERLGYSDRWFWTNPPFGRGSIIAYRPILDKPEQQNTEAVMDAVAKRILGQFDADMLISRLKSAHEAAQSIPDLERELRSVLQGMGYALTPLSPFVDLAENQQSIDPEFAQAIEDNIFELGSPEPDMSDWRNWREGDEVRCLESFGWGSRFLTGRIYKVERLTRDGIVIAGQNIGRHANDFRFHSRPEKAK